jgi:hypothetical protein
MSLWLALTPFVPQARAAAPRSRTTESEALRWSSESIGGLFVVSEVLIRVHPRNPRMKNLREPFPSQVRPLDYLHKLL